jgi:hypothetical protein
MFAMPTSETPMTPSQLPGTLSLALSLTLLGLIEVPG